VLGLPSALLEGQNGCGWRALSGVLVDGGARQLIADIPAGTSSVVEIPT
jgi:hypothetical protein